MKKILPKFNNFPIIPAHPGTIMGYADRPNNWLQNAKNRKKKKAEEKSAQENRRDEENASACCNLDPKDLVPVPDHCGDDQPDTSDVEPEGGLLLIVP
jgi:hypothetical protein